MVMTNSFGLCISPGYIPTEEELKELNPPFLRSIIYSLADLPKLYATNRRLIITLNNECKEVGSNWLGWETTVEKICYTLKDRLLVLSCGNEFDRHWQHNENDVPPEFAASLAKSAARICHRYGIKVSAVSVAGARWPEYLQQLADLCRNDVDYFDLHPYGKSPDNWGNDDWMFGRVSDAIQSARDIAKIDIICTEYGVKIGDAGGEQAVADFLSEAVITMRDLDVPYVSWFASEDAVGAPSERGEHAFGLKAENGSKRQAWHMYSVLNATGTSNEVHVIDNTKTIEKWQSLVGKGILEMMIEDNTEPAMASEWRPFNRKEGVPATIEECIGVNGTTYRWHLPTSNHWRIKPS